MCDMQIVRTFRCYSAIKYDRRGSWNGIGKSNNITTTTCGCSWQSTSFLDQFCIDFSPSSVKWTIGVPTREWLWIDRRWPESFQHSSINQCVGGGTTNSSPTSEFVKNCNQFGVDFERSSCVSSLLSVLSYLSRLVVEWECLRLLTATATTTATAVVLLFEISSIFSWEEEGKATALTRLQDQDLSRSIMHFVKKRHDKDEKRRDKDIRNDLHIYCII